MKITKRQLKRIIWESIIPGDGELNDDEAKLLQKLSKDAADEEPMEQDMSEPSGPDPKISDISKPADLDPKIKQFLGQLENDRLKLNKNLQAFTRSQFGNPNGTSAEKSHYLIARELPPIFDQISKNKAGSNKKLVNFVRHLDSISPSRQIDQLNHGLMQLAKILDR